MKLFSENRIWFNTHININKQRSFAVVSGYDILCKRITLFLSTLLLSLSSFAQWTSATDVNTPISVAANDQQDFRQVSDTKGGAIVAWADFRADTQNEAIYVQRISNAGIAMWTANGVLVCGTAGVIHSIPDIVEDGAGGAIIVWQDWRNGNKDLFAQRVDSNGTLLWASCGLPVAIKAFDQQSPRLVTDGAGGAIVVWQDSVNGNWDIFAQRINSSGATQWAAGGVSIVTAANEQINPKVDKDGSGGAYITWQDKRTGADYDIYAQKINAAGTIAWTTNGVVVCNAVDTQNNPKLRNSGSGVYIAWADKRNAHYDVYAQHLSTSGSPAWGLNGVQVCGSANNQTAIEVNADNVSGVVIAWKDQRVPSNIDIYAQKLNTSGVAQWATNGIAVVTTANDQINPDMVGDGSGGVIITWQDSSSGNYNVMAQKIDGSGNLVWNSGGNTVGNAAGNQVSPKVVGDGAGGAIIIFQDKRSGNFDLYAHRLLSNGTPASVEEKIVRGGLEVYPVPANSHAFVKHSLNADNLMIKIMDISGKDCSSLFRIEKKSGEILIVPEYPASGMFLLSVGDENTIDHATLLFTN